MKSVPGAGNLEYGGKVPTCGDGDAALDRVEMAHLVIQSAVVASLCRRTPTYPVATAPGTDFIPPLIFCKEVRPSILASPFCIEQKNLLIRAFRGYLPSQVSAELNHEAHEQRSVSISCDVVWLTAVGLENSEVAC